MEMSRNLAYSLEFSREAIKLSANYCTKSGLSKHGLDGCLLNFRADLPGSTAASGVWAPLEHPALEAALSLAERTLLFLSKFFAPPSCASPHSISGAPVLNNSEESGWREFKRRPHKC